MDGKTLYPNKTYTDEEYSQLSYNQKGSLRRARYRRRSPNNNEDAETQYSRTIKAAITDGINQALRSNEDNNTIPEIPSNLQTSNISATEQLRKRRRLNENN